MTEQNRINTNQIEDCLFCMDHIDEAALGILEAEDRERFEHHLTECAMCREELGLADAVVRLLPLASEPASPSPNVKAKLQNRLHQEQRVSSAPRAASLPKVDASTTEPFVSPQSKPTRSRPIWMYGTVAAGLCVALIFVGILNLLSDDAGSNLPSGNVQVYAMESNCEDCHQDTGGQIGADPEDSDGMVIAWNLDPNERHQVWCVNRAGERFLVGELNVAESGSVMQNFTFPHAVGDYDQIYVARHDGTEELTVTPGKSGETDDPTPTQTPTATD